MDICNPNSIVIIPETQCLSESINTINSNFETLSSMTCQLKERVENIRMSRTFFYYGPNSEYVPDPSPFIGGAVPTDFTISTFVNSPDELDLGIISYPEDTVYVIYQTTFYQTATITSGFRVPRIQPRLTPFSKKGVKIPTIRTEYSKPRIIAFNYTTLDNRTGRLRKTPDIRPINIVNPKSLGTKVRYTVEWQVNNAKTSNMNTGSYRFVFTTSPGETANFKNILRRWLSNNIGKTNVNIAGIITQQGTSSITSAQNPPTGIRGVNIANMEISPIFYIWKLTFENRPERGLNYYINNGWPKIHQAQTSGVDNINWNRPELWLPYESW